MVFVCYLPKTQERMAQERRGRPVGCCDTCGAEIWSRQHKVWIAREGTVGEPCLIHRKCLAAGDVIAPAAKAGQPRPTTPEEGRDG